MSHAVPGPGTPSVGVREVGGSNEQWHSLFEGMHRVQPAPDQGTLLPGYIG